MSAPPSDAPAPSGSTDLQQQIRDLTRVGLPNGPSGGESSNLPVSSSFSATSPGVVPRGGGGGGGGGTLFPGGVSVPSSFPGQGGGAALPPLPNTRLTSFQTPVGGGSTPFVTRSSLTTSSAPMKTEEAPTPRGIKPDALLTSEDDAPLHELIYFDGDYEKFCGAIVASGGQVCCALAHLCRYQHLKKSQAPPGYYIKSFNANGAFYVEPFLPHAVAEGSPAFMSLVASGTKLSLAKWSSLFAIVLEGKLDAAIVEDVMEEESEKSQTPSTPSLKKPRYEQGADIYSFLEQIWRKQAELEGKFGLTEKDGDHATLSAALRAAHHRLSELEDQIKVFESRLLIAQGDAQAAHDKVNLLGSNGVDVTKAVTEFERVAGAKYADAGRLLTVENNLNKLMAGAKETNTLVVQLWNAVNGLVRGGTTTVMPAPQGEDVTQAEYNKLLKRVVEVEKKQGSLTFSVGGRTFSCQEDATIWAAEHMPPDMWECFIGLMHLLNFPDEVTAEASDTVTEQLHATKTGLSTLKIAAITSFKSTYPHQLTGTSKPSTTPNTAAVDTSSSVSATTAASPFRKMASRKQWNAGNELTGLKFTVRASSFNKTNELTEHIRTVLDGNPQAMELCLSLLQSAWSAVDWLIAQVDSFYNRLASTACPEEGTCSPAMEKMIWGVVTSSLKAFFDELRTVRVKAVSAHHLPTDQRNGAFLWATMQELAKINEFRHQGFQEHMRIYHRIVMHLLDTYATKESVKTLIAETSVKASLNGINTRLGEFDKKHANMNTAIGNAQRDINALKRKN